MANTGGAVPSEVDYVAVDRFGGDPRGHGLPAGDV